MPNETAILVREAEPLAVQQGESEVVQLIRMALDKGQNPTELYAILDREREQRARRQFNSAFAEFQRTCGPVLKRTVDANPKMTRADRDGQKVQRRYASIEDIELVVGDKLRSLGFAYGWTGAPPTADGMIVDVFVLRHVGGWDVPTMSNPFPVEGSPAWRTMAGNREPAGMSPQQAVLAAETYAKRSSMLKGLGCTATYDDSALAMDRAPLIDAQQVAQLRQLCEETKTDPNKGLLIFAAAESLEKIKTGRFDAVVKLLEAKRKALVAP